jgi:hypothetical protein
MSFYAAFNSREVSYTERGYFPFPEDMTVLEAGISRVSDSIFKLSSGWYMLEVGCSSTLGGNKAIWGWYDVGNSQPLGIQLTGNPQETPWCFYGLAFLKTDGAEVAVYYDGAAGVTLGKETYGLPWIKITQLR